MRSFITTFFAALSLATMLALPACEDSAGETAGSAGAGNSAGNAGSGTTAGNAGTGGNGGNAGTAGNAGNAGTAGSGSTSATCPGDPAEELSGEIGADKTLTADKCWLLKGIVYVKKGATLTIEAGTTVMGDQVSLGTLVIQPGARLVADGEADKPIVFTSQNKKGQRAAGDWGGVILLGSAPINIMGGKANVEGIPVSPETAYGGDKADDDSGILRYIRIEFGGIQLSPNNEINGLTLAGVGDKTVLDSIEVHDTLDDCFEFFGGTVNAKHLLCVNNQDDGIDWDNGYSGKLQFIALQQDAGFEDDTNAFEADNDANGSVNTPLSSPTIYNATLVGKNLKADGAKQQYGMLLRRSTKGEIYNAIAIGFEACIDIRDPNTAAEIKNSICFGNGYGTVENNIAYAETANGMGVLQDDDAGLDERTWFNAAARKNAETDPKLADPFGAKPDFTPAATLETNAATPPDDGFFDKAATYIGAFKAGDTWAKGAWVSYERD